MSKTLTLQKPHPVEFRLLDPFATKPTRILLHFLYKSNIYEYLTPLKVDPRNWNQQAFRVSWTDPANVVKNTELDLIEYIVQKVQCESVENLTKEQFMIQVEEQKSKYTKCQNENEKDKRLTDYAAAYSKIQCDRCDITDRTKAKVVTVVNHLNDYEAEKGEGILVADVDKRFFENFKKWSFQSKKHSISTVNKHIKIIKQMMEYALDEKMTENTIGQSRRLNVKVPKSNKIVLYEDELKKIEKVNLDYSESLDTVRDICLIGCETGQRFSDFSRINKSKVQEFKGIKFIHLWSLKSDCEVAIPFTSRLQRVLVKHNYKCPKVSLKTYNKQIKKVCESAGINTRIIWRTTNGGRLKKQTLPKFSKVTSHVCRRSFASNMTLLGFPARMLMEITGHATESQFQEYINIRGKLNVQTVHQLMKNLKITI